MRYYFVDLDDTLVKGINCTWDFIKDYYYFSNRAKEFRIRERIAKILTKIVHNKFLKRQLKIILLFFGIRYKNLINFSQRIWIPMIIKGDYLNKNLLKKLTGKNKILLTACTEIPARQIAEHFGFDNCICTEFRVWNGKIIGIKKDTFLIKKKYVLLEKYDVNFLKKCTYITDKEEKGLFENVFGEIIYV